MLARHPVSRLGIRLGASISARQASFGVLSKAAARSHSHSGKREVKPSSKKLLRMVLDVPDRFSWPTRRATSTSTSTSTLTVTSTSTSAPLLAVLSTGALAARAFSGGPVHADSRLRNSEKESNDANSSASSKNAKYPAITLYQYKICPYCNKVKAVLDYLGIPYSALEVNPVSKAEIKGEGFDGYKKVPVCRIGSEQVNDSPVILARILDLAAEQGHEIGQQAGDPRQKKWMEWVDRKLAVLLFPNITRSMSESMQAFSYIWDVPHFSTYDKVLNRYAGAVAMRLAQGKIKKKYDIDDEREALDVVVKEWTEAVGSSAFLTGDSVSLADLCVFGCLRAIEDMDTFTDVLNSHADLKAWYNRVADAVGDSACTEWR